MTAVFVSLITFLSTGLGGFAALRLRDRLHLLLGFSSGAVVAVALFDVLPEVFKHVGEGPVPVTVGTAVGFLVFYTMERFTSMHASREHEHEGERHQPELGLAGAAGLTIHSFFDGVAIGIGFQASSALGLLIALAVILHDASDGLNTVTVVLAHGNGWKTAAGWLAADMTTPVLGAASTLLFRLPETVVPWFLAFFAGFFLYIGAADLLPEARAHKGLQPLLMTALGMAVVFAVTRFV